MPSGADPRQLDALRHAIDKQDPDIWGKWRQEHPIEHIRLAGIDLHKACMRDLDLKYADLTGANLRGAWLGRAKLDSARLVSADLTRTYLGGADLSCATFDEAICERTNFVGASLRNAQFRNTHLDRAALCGATLDGTWFIDSVLTEVDLTRSVLIDTAFRNSRVEGCDVYGISAWDLRLDNDSSTRDLRITPRTESPILVDDFEVAQFIYLILKNPNIRKIIDTVGRKGVLILGRFTRERKAVLEAIRSELRRLGFVPMLFDFERPADRNFTETVVTMVGMSLFVVVDITNPRSSPLELQASLPLFNIPFVPLIQKGEEPFSMFADLQSSFGGPNRGRILDVLIYSSADVLVRVFEKAVVGPALARGERLSQAKEAALRTRDAEDYL